MHRNQFQFAFLCLIAFCLAPTATANAALLDVPLHFLTLNLNGEKLESHGAGINSEFSEVDELSGPSGAFWQGFAQARTEGAGAIGNVGPIAFARAEGEANGVENASGSFDGISGLTRASTRLVYSTRIAELDALPFSIPSGSVPLQLPVEVHVEGIGSAEVVGPHGVAAGFGRAFVAGLPAGILEVQQVPGCTLCLQRATDAISKTFDFSFVAGQTIGVMLEAFAESQAGAGGDTAFGKAIAMILIDPVFSFNQAAFDEIALARGFPTFDLNRYFAFEFSPGAETLPPSVVPLPAAGLLLSSGLAMLAWIRRRRPASVA